MTLTLETMIQDILDSLVVDQTNDLYMCTALSGEVGELCNFIKKENRTNGFRFKYKEDTDMENIDVIYYAIAAAITRITNGDLTTELERNWHIKMNHNEKKYHRIVKNRPFICLCKQCRTGDYS